MAAMVGITQVVRGQERDPVEPERREDVVPMPSW
jgi:hypothetical protein